MSALRECDFCASPLVVMRGSGTQGMYWTQCGHCHAEGPVCDTEAEALAAWNRQAGDAEAEALRARVRRLEGALRECANDLEAYVMREYSGSILTPGNALRRARDLAPVDEARAVLEDRT